MTKYYEWPLKLTDHQKMNLVKSIKNKCPLTLRIKYLNLIKTDDKLLVTERQMNKIDKAMDKGTGLDLKLGKEQIRKIAKHGGNRFTSLATLGAKVLPYAVKGVSKAVPALATGAVSALGSLGIDKIFGKGIINIPKKYFPMLPSIVNKLTKRQIDQINRVSQTGGRLVLKPTRKQIEGGLLGTPASIGILMAISLVSYVYNIIYNVWRWSSS